MGKHVEFGVFPPPKHLSVGFLESNNITDAVRLFGKDSDFVNSSFSRREEGLQLRSGLELDSIVDTMRSVGFSVGKTPGSRRGSSELRSDIEADLRQT